MNRPRPAAAADRTDPQVRRWISRELAREPPSAPSLIVTVWGDALLPHGGTVFLPGLIRLMSAFDCNERLVRTGVFRLVRQGWLVSTPIGRRSLYSLTPDGARRFSEAHRRIYASPREDWDGTWEIVIGGDLTAAERRALTTELHWAGLGDFGPGVLGRPSQPESPVHAILRAQDVLDRVAVVRATDPPAPEARTLCGSVSQAWDLAGVAAQYRRLIRRFGTVIERFREREEAGHDPEQCFVVRTLLIHSYRRVLLRDPRLPPALLPLDWPGAAAFALCRDFYRLTHRAAGRHLAATLEGAQGPLPRAAPEFFRRFGGL